jgi:hypothetical protein
VPGAAANNFSFFFHLYHLSWEVFMKCLNCKKELVKTGLVMQNGTVCAGEKIEIKCTPSGEEYIVCRHCKSRNFIQDIGDHAFTIAYYTFDKS